MQRAHVFVPFWFFLFIFYFGFFGITPFAVRQREPQTRSETERRLEGRMKESETIETCGAKVCVLLKGKTPLLLLYHFFFVFQVREKNRKVIITILHAVVSFYFSLFFLFGRSVLVVFFTSALY